jgi:hypothetical protein
MMVPPKGSRSPMAAHRRGSVKVSVQPEKDSLLAIEIWNADDKRRARGAVKAFEASYGAKYPKAVSQSGV